MTLASLQVREEDILREEQRRRPGVETMPISEQHAHAVNWIRSNVKIQDPILPNGEGPFDLYDYQEEFIGLWLAEVDKARRGRPAGIRTEKSRQMGDSWLFMALCVYALRHWRNFRALVISRKQSKVDDGGQSSTPDSLMGKSRFIWERLRGEEKFPLASKYLSLVNPETNGTILGEAANPNAGRGGTFLFGLWDETAATEHSWSILASWEQAVRCPYYLSTPQGNTNVFAHLRHSPTLQQVRHHWSQHPIKSQGLYRCPGGIKHEGQSQICEGGEMRSPWYDEQCKRMPPELIAQELDISYERSVHGRAFPEFDAEIHGVRDLMGEPAGVWVASIDPGATTAAMVLLQFVELPRRIECRVIDCWEAHDATAHTYADMLTTWKAEYGISRLYVCGDPSGYNRDLTDGRSVFGELQKHGWRVEAPFFLSKVGDRVRLTRDFMGGRETPKGVSLAFAYRADLEMFADRVVVAKWPTNSDGVVTTETDLAHNEAEHIADALTYGVAWYMGREKAQVFQAPRTSRTRPYTAGLLNTDF